MNNIDAGFAGGPVEDERFYIERPCDDELIGHITSPLKPRFTYIYAPRQSGKTSLLKRTKKILSEKYNYSLILIDAKALRKSSRVEWYGDLFNEILKSFPNKKLGNPHSLLSAPDPLREFMGHIVPKLDSIRTIIMFDEFDQINPGEQDFAWIDFLKLLRDFDTTGSISGENKERARWGIVMAAFNNPASLLERVPISIREGSNSPIFNTYRVINIKDFDRVGTEKLAGVLQTYKKIEGDTVDRIHYWANGQPYLTQKIMIELGAVSTETISAETVDGVVAEILMDTDDSNLRNMRDKLRLMNQTHKDILEKMLNANINTHQGILEQMKPVTLQGLTVVSSGKIMIRNNIYKKLIEEEIGITEISPGRLVDVSLNNPSRLYTVWMFLISLLLVLFSTWCGVQIGQLKWFVEWLYKLLPTFPAISLMVKVAGGILCFLTAYTILWLGFTKSKYENASEMIDDLGAAFVFKKCARPNSDFVIQVELDRNIHKKKNLFPLNVKGAHAKRMQWLLGFNQITLGANQPIGELKVNLTYGFCWQALISPLPVYWKIPVIVEYSDVDGNHMFKTSIFVFVDAQESWPNIIGLLVSPIRKLIEWINKLGA